MRLPGESGVAARPVRATVDGLILAAPEADRVPEGASLMNPQLSAARRDCRSWRLRTTALQSHAKQNQPAVRVSDWAHPVGVNSIRTFSGVESAARAKCVR
ncbi:hypothetical protein GCM10018965_008550 [Nonomuraea roseola]